MSSSSKTFWDINKTPQNHLQKVNFRKYLTNVREPAVMASGTKSDVLDIQSGIIEETYLRKRIFRKLANNLRIRSKS